MANPSQTIHGRSVLQESSSLPPAPNAGAITSELSVLSASVQTLKCRFDELHNHLGFIQNSIDDLNVKLTANLESASIENLALNNERMLECGLGKRLVSMLSNVPKLWEQVPAALKLASNPAKLVFECIRHVEDHVIEDFQALSLILELFLLMIGDCADGEVEIEASTKQEAEAVALSWRKKLIHKGDCLIDDRTLLLFVASFGIPADFPIEYMMNLIVQSHPSEISQALRQSRFLVPILPDVIEKMIERKLYLEAVDIIKTFGIDEASLKIRRDGVFMELVDHAIHIPKVLDEAKQRQKTMRILKVRDVVEQKRKRKSLPRSVQESLHHQMILDHCLCTWPPFEWPRM